MYLWHLVRMADYFRILVAGSLSERLAHLTEEGIVVRFFKDCALFGIIT